jgi:hypothetical protein
LCLAQLRARAAVVGCNHRTNDVITSRHVQCACVARWSGLAGFIPCQNTMCGVRSQSEAANWCPAAFALLRAYAAGLGMKPGLTGCSACIRTGARVPNVAQVCVCACVCMCVCARVCLLAVPIVRTHRQREMERAPEHTCTHTWPLHCPDITQVSPTRHTNTHTHTTHTHTQHTHTHTHAKCETPTASWRAHLGRFGRG